MCIAACKCSLVIYKCCIYGIYWYNPVETDLSWIMYTHMLLSYIINLINIRKISLYLKKGIENMDSRFTSNDN